MVDKDGDEAKTPLQQVLTLLLRKKKKISPMSNVFTIEGRAILPTNIFKKRTKSQKTSDSLGYFHIEEINIDNTPETTLEQVPCI